MSPSDPRAAREARSAFPEERQRKIAHLIGVNGRVRVSELAERFGVSEATLRKDLSSLEQAGLLKRTHGGAVGTTRAVERDLDERVEANAPAKEVIARACATEVQAGDAVFIGAGTTTARIAHHLTNTHVTVLTNSIAVARTVATKPGIEHVLLGGRLRPVGGSVIGAVTLDTLARFSVNIGFIGVSGLTADGIYVADVEEARVARTVIDRSNRVMVPADQSKIGTTHFSRISTLKSIDALVTDRGSAALNDLCQEHDIDLIVPEEPPGAS